MDSLLGMIASVVVGIAAVIVVCGIISKSNIAEKIKEAFKAFLTKKKQKKPSQKELDELFGAVIKEKQGKSVNVDVFFGNTEDPKKENITLEAEEIADDIKKGDWINLTDDNLAAMDDEDISDVEDEDAPQIIEIDSL